METSTSRSTSHNNPPECLIAMLSIDLGAIERCDRDAFEKIKQRCASCNSRQYCELALRHINLLQSL